MPTDEPLFNCLPIDTSHRRECDVCNKPMELRAYAAYNADHGENVHALHARYPGPQFRTCAEHLGQIMLQDAEKHGSTRQWLVVVIGD